MSSPRTLAFCPFPDRSRLRKIPANPAAAWGIAKPNPAGAAGTPATSGQRHRERPALARRDHLRLHHGSRADRRARALQRPPCQHDHLACLPRSRLGLGRGRGPPAPRHQHRTPARCSGGMEPSVPRAWVKSARIARRLQQQRSPLRQSPALQPSKRRIPAANLVRQERNFWTQRQGRENRRQRQQRPAETETG